MKSNEVILSYRENIRYPDKKGLFRPGVCYPEYPFKEYVSCEENNVYDMVRQCFYLAGLDRERYGTEEWNPLGAIIEKGETVLLKPNMVMHKNLGDGGEECLYTNPAVVAAVIDYVYIALKHSGKIIVADAPMQECDFAELIEESGYKDLVHFYLSQNVDIGLVDLRNKATKLEGRIHKVVKECDNGIVVDLAQKSHFASLTPETIRNLRITNYDPTVLMRNHNEDHHKYCIASSVLKADVVINMPKPKTHRKAGVTIAQKNLIGVNASKEYLPHHSLGSKSGGGDAYEKPNFFLAFANKTLDWKNILENKGMTLLCKEVIFLHRIAKFIGKKLTGEKFFEGSWYGNDTIWRTIKDINYIVGYADKNGVIRDTIQRKQITIADLIVAGEGEGPISPLPHSLNTIAMGYDNLIFDRVVCSLMGIDCEFIPSIRKGDIGQESIISNNVKWHQKSNKDLYQMAERFVLASGWEGYDRS